MSDSSIERTLETYRATRREIEAGVLSVASSVDGHRFTLQASLHDLAFETGGYVILEDRDRLLLGQVLSLELVHHDGPELDIATGGETDLRANIVVRSARGEEPSYSCEASSATPSAMRSGVS